MYNYIECEHKLASVTKIKETSKCECIMERQYIIKDTTPSRRAKTALGASS